MDLETLIFKANLGAYKINKNTHGDWADRWAALDPVIRSAMESAYALGASDEAFKHQATDWPAFARKMLSATAVRCPAYICHGPGHQSKTMCEHTSPHTTHYAHVLGQETSWKGDKAFSGAFDELPQDED